MYSNNTFFHCTLPSRIIRVVMVAWIYQIYQDLCNHRVAKQSKAGPQGAESSCGESTMLSARTRRPRQK